MTMRFDQYLADEQATVAFGAQLAPLIADGAVIYMYGDLGAGKTTLAWNRAGLVISGLRVQLIPWLNLMS